MGLKLLDDVLEVSSEISEGVTFRGERRDGRRSLARAALASSYRRSITGDTNEFLYITHKIPLKQIGRRSLKQGGEAAIQIRVASGCTSAHIRDVVATKRSVFSCWEGSVTILGQVPRTIRPVTVHFPTQVSGGWVSAYQI